MPDFVQNSTLKPDAPLTVGPLVGQGVPDPLKGGQPLFEGYYTPFRFSPATGITQAVAVDARGQLVPMDVYNRWVAAGKPHYPDKSASPDAALAAGADIGGAGGTGASLIDDPSIKTAWEQYLKGIDDGSSLKGLLGLDPTQPLPTSIATTLAAPQVGKIADPRTVTGRDVAAIGAPATITGQNVDSIAAPTVGPASAAEGTTVQGADTARLEQIAAGRGPLADEVRAANEIAVMRAGQQANSLANQARGAERRGLRRAAMIQGADQAFAGQLQATQTLAQKATEATTKIADLDNQKKQLQAQLDAARRNNDADRAQKITEKIADIEVQIRKANADIATANANRDVDVQGRNVTNTIDVAGKNADIDTANANRDVTVQDTNVDNTTDIGKANADIEAGNAGRTLEAADKTVGHALTAQDQEEKQRIERGRFRIEVTDAINRSAKGLLDEAGRQAALAMARKELAIAEARLKLEQNAQRRAEYEADRAFWTTAITSLLAYAIPGPKPPATGGAKPNPFAHGGAVTGRQLIEVGEAGDHELIIPIKAKLSDRLAAALDVGAKPFDAAGAARVIDTPDELAEAVAASMRTFQAKHAPRQEEAPPWDDEVMGAMAGGLIRGRKRRMGGGY